jgi:phosphatidylinositol-3-phosphatase
MRFPAVPLALLAMTACAAAAPSTPTPPLCGTRTTPPSSWEHVAWIWFENHGYDRIVGSRDAPFMNGVLARGCGLATDYHAIAHPSLPNYIAATSGLAGRELAPFRNDCNARGDCRIGAPSLFEQAGSWRAYAESMRKPCTRFFTGAYAASHNPAVYYTRLADCAERAVGMKTLRADVATDALPSFVFITPNMCHSMHDCSVRTGDAWLRRVVTVLAASPAYQRGTMAVMVTFDESDGGDNHVATFVVAPSVVPGTRASEPFSHYSLLRTTEAMLGLAPPLGRARTATDMRAAFDL